jgi:hypothetical protein
VVRLNLQFFGIDINCQCFLPSYTPPGGDRGGDRFPMLLKVILCLNNESPIFHHFEVADVSRSQNDIETLKKMF